VGGNGNEKRRFGGDVLGPDSGARSVGFTTKKSGTKKSWGISNRFMRSGLGIAKSKEGSILYSRGDSVVSLVGFMAKRCRAKKFRRFLLSFVEAVNLTGGSAANQKVLGTYRTVKTPLVSVSTSLFQGRDCLFGRRQNVGPAAGAIYFMVTSSDGVEQSRPKGFLQGNWPVFYGLQ
jgi:hypothetical protein